MNKSSNRIPQVLVCQRGARHRYAIPRMLEERGMLAALFTDSTARSPVGLLAQGIGRMGVASARLKSLASRNPLGIPHEKIFSSDQPFYASLLGGLISPELGRTYQEWGLQGADVVYSMYGEDFGFLQWAKARGAKIMVDVFVHPDTNRIVEEETELFMEREAESSFAIERENQHSRRCFELADILLCPSQWVADGVREFVPACAEKIRVSPYGSSLNRADSINERPSEGTILFAGREPLRKGLHYLADAAKRIRESGMKIEVRVAGVSPNEVDWMENKGELNCLGTLPMDQMKDEFRRADVFVLPSLSEGQAGVLLEAMACGCPVIATRESGIDFDPGCGVTVPARDASGLAEAIRNVIGNRDRRTALAKGALRQSVEFSMDAWQRRLVEAIAEVGVINRSST